MTKVGLSDLGNRRCLVKMFLLNRHRYIVWEGNYISIKDFTEFENYDDHSRMFVKFGETYAPHAFLTDTILSFSSEDELLEYIAELSL